MTLADLGVGIYFGILVAAIVEGEVSFVAAAAAVSQGKLNPIGVIVAGAIGAATGDQFYFYLLRGRLTRWLDRYPSIARRGQALASRVRKHDTFMTFIIRFAPGLRIALAAACAYAGVKPLKFSLLNGLAAVLWATGLMTLVAWAGPTFLPRLGISGWWSALVPALIIVIVFRVVGRMERQAIEDQPDDSGQS
jgi:membrane-associated protein